MWQVYLLQYQNLSHEVEPSSTSHRNDPSTASLLFDNIARMSDRANRSKYKMWSRRTRKKVSGRHSLNKTSVTLAVLWTVCMPRLVVDANDEVCRLEAAVAKSRERHILRYHKHENVWRAQMTTYSWKSLTMYGGSRAWIACSYTPTVSAWTLHAAWREASAADVTWPRRRVPDTERAGFLTTSGFKLDTVWSNRYGSEPTALQIVGCECVWRCLDSFHLCELTTLYRRVGDECDGRIWAATVTWGAELRTDSVTSYI